MYLKVLFKHLYIYVNSNNLQIYIKGNKNTQTYTTDIQALKQIVKKILLNSKKNVFKYFFITKIIFYFASVIEKQNISIYKKRSLSILIHCIY